MKRLNILLLTLCFTPTLFSMDGASSSSSMSEKEKEKVLKAAAGVKAATTDKERQKAEARFAKLYDIAGDSETVHAAAATLNLPTSSESRKAAVALAKRRIDASANKQQSEAKSPAFAQDGIDTIVALHDTAAEKRGLEQALKTAEGNIARLTNELSNLGFLDITKRGTLTQELGAWKKQQNKIILDLKKAGLKVGALKDYARETKEAKQQREETIKGLIASLSILKTDALNDAEKTISNQFIQNLESEFTETLGSLISSPSAISESEDATFRTLEAEFSNAVSFLHTLHNLPQEQQEQRLRYEQQLKASLERLQRARFTAWEV